MNTHEAVEAFQVRWMCPLKGKNKLELVVKVVEDRESLDSLLLELSLLGIVPRGIRRITLHKVTINGCLDQSGS